MANKNQGRAASATPANPTTQIPPVEVQQSGSSQPSASDQIGQTDNSDRPESSQDAGDLANPPPGGADSEIQGDSEVTLATIRHKTQYPSYHRVGLVLTKQPKEYRVSRDQLDILNNDPWVEVLKA